MHSIYLLSTLNHPKSSDILQDMKEHDRGFELQTQPECNAAYNLGTILESFGVSREFPWGEEDQKYLNLLIKSRGWHPERLGTNYGEGLDHEDLFVEGVLKTGESALRQACPMRLETLLELSLHGGKDFMVTELVDLFVRKERTSVFLESPYALSQKLQYKVNNPTPIESLSVRGKTRRIKRSCRKAPLTSDKIAG